MRRFAATLARTRRTIGHTIHGTMAARASALLGVYAICRVLFYLANREHFTDLGSIAWVDIFRGGLLFDISAVCYTNFFFATAIQRAHAREPPVHRVDPVGPTRLASTVRHGR